MNFVFVCMRTQNWLLFFAILSPFFGHSQFNIGYELSNTIPVIKNGDSLYLPWAGGLNNPQFSAMNFTGDDALELFVFDRDGALRKGFKFNNQTGKYEWVHTIPEDSIAFHKHFPKLVDRGFCLIRDFDGDGKGDVFTTRDYQNIGVFKNNGSVVPSFSSFSEGLITKNGGQTHPIRILGNQLPVIADLDNDSDLDIMFFGVNLYGQPFGCNTFATFENQSVEDYGSNDSLKFKVADRCWGKITPTSGTHPISNWRAFDCDTTCANDGQRHQDVTMTQQLHDMNGDGELDLLITYDHNDELYSMPNTSTSAHGTIDVNQIDYQFPSNDVQVEMNNQPYPYFIDVDLDGDDDMLLGANQLNNASTLEYDTSNAVIVDQFYKNIGSNSAPEFVLEKRGYLSGEMIDVGLLSFPTLADLTGDGLPDLLVGNIGYNTFNDALSSARLSFYKNVGSLGNPAFELINEDYANVSQLNLRLAHPALADLDNDGDIDLIVGDHTGHLQYFKNIGHPLSANFSQLTPNFNLIDAGIEAHPQFFDLNSDGLLDLVVGNENGTVQYFENVGTSSAPDFSSTPTISKLGAINVYNSLDGKTIPYLTRKLDSTNNLYLLLGTGNGRINIYGPIASITDTFNLVDSIVVEASQTSITGVNLINDFTIELIIGQRTGGLYFMERKKLISLGNEEVKSKINPSIQLYPNPTKGMVDLKLRTYSEVGKLIITDLQGRNIQSKDLRPKAGFFIENIDLRSYPSGIYLISVQENETITWAKLIKE
jgi:hypothetical protein